MFEKDQFNFGTHWGAWGDWQPRPGTTVLLLFALMAIGTIFSLALEAVLGSADHPIIRGFSIGALPMLLGIAALALREARRSLPMQILLLLFGYSTLSLLTFLFSAGAIASAIAETTLTLNWTLVAWGWALLALTGFLFLPRVRLSLARFLPIDASDFAHAYALSMGVAMVSLSTLSLIPFGEPFIYQIPADDIQVQSALERNVSLLATAIWSVPAVFLAVGFSRSLNLRETCARLGFQPITSKHLLWPVLFSILMVGAGIGLGNLIEWVWGALGIPITDAERFAEFAALPLHPLGMLLLGISAGVSEEMFVRGVLQPRLGLVFSNVLFAAAHAFQYATDGLLVVFLLGLAFGVIRERFGLIPAIATHALYNFILLLIGTFANIG